MRSIEDLYQLYLDQNKSYDNMDTDEVVALAQWLEHMSEREALITAELNAQSAMATQLNDIYTAQLDVAKAEYELATLKAEKLRAEIAAMTTTADDLGIDDNV